MDAGPQHPSQPSSTNKSDPSDNRRSVPWQISTHLKQKYAPVITTIEKLRPLRSHPRGRRPSGRTNPHQGTVPSTVVANRVWDAIKKVDPTYSDLKHEIGTSGGETQPVTIKSGDTLSAISLLFYGNANKYPQIAKPTTSPTPTASPSAPPSSSPSLTEAGPRSHMPQIRIPHPLRSDAKGWGIRATTRTDLYPTGIFAVKIPRNAGQ